LPVFTSADEGERILRENNSFKFSTGAEMPHDAGLDDLAMEPARGELDAVQTEREPGVVEGFIAVSRTSGHLISKFVDERGEAGVLRIGRHGLIP
jgi:hypothetical protein